MYLSILNVSVDLRVPEHGLVPIAPEELFGSIVHVRVLDGPFGVSKVALVLSVLGVLQLDLDNGDCSQDNSGESNKVGDLLPSRRDGAGVLDLLFVGLSKGLASLQIGLVGEVVDQGRHTEMVTGESFGNKLLCSVKHACALLVAVSFHQTIFLTLSWLSVVADWSDPVTCTWYRMISALQLSEKMSGRKRIGSLDERRAGCVAGTDEARSLAFEELSCETKLSSSRKLRRLIFGCKFTSRVSTAQILYHIFCYG